MQSLGAEVNNKSRFALAPQHHPGAGTIETEPKPLQAVYIDQDIGELVSDEGKSQYFRNAFWACMSEEVSHVIGFFHSQSAEDLAGPQDCLNARGH